MAHPARHQAVLTDARCQMALSRQSKLGWLVAAGWAEARGDLAWVARRFVRGVVGGMLVGCVSCAKLGWVIWVI